MEVKIPFRAAPQVVLCRHQTDKTFGSFIDAEYVFHYIEKGVCKFRLEDRLYLLDAGHIILIPPHLPHAMLPRDDGYAHLFVIHFVYHGDVEHAAAFPMVASVTRSERPQVADHFFSLRDAWDKKKAGYELTAAGKMMELLGMHVANSGSTPTPRVMSSKAWRNVEAAICLMHRNCERDWSIEGISREVGLSPNYFCKVFKEYTGKPPHDFLNHLRVEKAKSLLCSSELNCSETAERVGFSSVHLFSKVFKRHTDFSPMQWARKIGE